MTSPFVIGVNELVGKRLEPESRYAIHDLDGDGVVSDEELRREERMMRMENADQMADQQRKMCWVSMISVVLSVFVVMTPLVNVEKLPLLTPFLTTFCVSNMGIIGAFMATSVWKRNGESNGK